MYSSTKTCRFFERVSSDLAFLSSIITPIGRQALFINIVFFERKKFEKKRLFGNLRGDKTCNKGPLKKGVDIRISLRVS